VSDFAGTERFELVRPLGQGAFGVVYQAIDRGLGSPRSVALKLLRRPYADRLARFKREFRALVELRHPNLVQLHELVASDAHVFFTMELVDGSSPLDYARYRPDEARELLRQLAEGLSALHRAGKLHRDVKPSNILVEKGGRLVLLDFGLAVELDGRDSVERAGTPLYMSPEQCAEQPLGEASDWYAAGVVLFELLAGRPPFEGTVTEVLEAKQSSPAPRVSSFAPAVPGDLDDLCAALLSRDPAQRPSGDEVLRRLRAAPQPAPPRHEPFVGRAVEQATLARLFEESAQGRCTVALARGPSGIGKSALLRRFLDELRRHKPEAMILAGRCFELESVPYKALDAIIDELARQLRRLPDVESAALLPRDPGALATLFPVLRQVRTFEQPGTQVGPGESTNVRSRGLTALRELFARMADRRPVVVCVDDLQWGGVDSAALLAELIRPPDPPAVFWLASFRDEEAATSPLLRRLTQLRETTLADVPIHDLQLAGLESAEAQQLATTLLAASDDQGRARRIAEESGGNPFFVHELARAGGGDHALGALVRARTGQLEGATRRILDVVAVAARPLELEVVAGASETGAELGDALAALRAEHLIRAREAQHERLIECYHDRIREAVVAALAPAELAAIHLKLAAALERQGSADPAQIGRHLAEGGDPARAQVYLARAAEQAASALAFEEASQLYERALALQPLLNSGSDPVALELAYADALSAAGHGQDAARAWLALVDRVDQQQRYTLRRRAAEELLLAGQVDEGYAAMDALFAELGLSVPRTTAGVLTRVAWGRLALALQGRTLRERAEPASDRELQRVDVLGSLTWASLVLEPLVGYALQTQHLRLALRSGDRLRAAIALMLEAPLSAMKGSRTTEATRRTLKSARDMLAGAVTDQMPEGLSRVIEATVAMLEGRWSEGLAFLENAEQMRNSSALGHSSMRGFIYAVRAMNRFWMGRSGDVLAALPSQIRDMEEHSNLYGWLWLKLLESWALSCSGRMEAAWAGSEAVRARLPERVFQLQRWYLEFGQVKFLLIEGKAEQAWKLLEEVERRTRFGMLGQAQRFSGRLVRANTALARAVETPAVRDPMLAEARRLARLMDKERAPWIDALTATLRASIAKVAGDRDESFRLLRDCEPLLEAHHLEAVLACTRVARGRLIGGDTGRALVERGESWMTGQRVSPLVARVLIPGLTLE
jgi:eukaryotic-like serine/threonine-protein kinase